MRKDAGAGSGGRTEMVGPPEVGGAGGRLLILGAAGAAAVFLIVYRGLFSGSKIFTHDSIIWYGSFHYFVVSMASGVFPLWDPYMLTGTYFYPNLSIFGLLDPSVLAAVAAVSVFHASPLTMYVWFRMFRFAVFLVGAFLFFSQTTGCRRSSLLTTAILMVALSPSYFRQSGTIDLVLLAPLSMFFSLRLFESTDWRRRRLYLSSLALTVGISMNIFIPTYFLFNLLAFWIVSLTADRSYLTNVRLFFGAKKQLLFTCALVVIVLMMAAPPLTVMFRDASGGGELFPMLRIAQKNDGMLKKVMASDLGSNALSGTFTGEKGVFASYGNMANLVYPDVFESVPFFADDRLSEIAQYIGIIPFVLACLGMLFYRSRFRGVAAVMMAVIAVNMFSFAGMSGKPFNAVQKVFNVIFPPLAMIEVRESFGSYFLLYLGVFLCMGCAIFFDEVRFGAFVKRRLPVIFGICLGIIGLKAGLTWIYGVKAIYASPYDLFVLLQLALFPLMAFFFSRRTLRPSLFYAIVVVMIVADLFVYCSYGRKYVLWDRGPIAKLLSVGGPASGRPGFDYFREPIASPPELAFGESMLKVKGVLTYGNNHSIFTTKRYYDLLTHLPFGRQLALSGVEYPLLTFFPGEMAVHVPDKKQALQRLISAQDDAVMHSLIVEDDDGRALPPSAQMGSFSSYEDIDWLIPDRLYRRIGLYEVRHGLRISANRRRIQDLLNTPEYALSVREFSPNDITISVKNEREGYLLYNDGWSRYWRAFDGQREVPLLIANYNAKAVYLKKGLHTVRFVFDPVHYKIGLVLYYAGLLTACGTIIFLSFLGRRESRR